MLTSIYALSLIRAQLPGQIVYMRSNYGSLVSISCLGSSFPPTAALGIFIYLAEWHIERGAKRILTSNFRSRERCNRIFQQFITDRQSIVDIEFNENTHGIEFMLNGGLKWTLWPSWTIIEPDDDIVNFFIPGKQILCYSPAQKFYFEKDGEICTEEDIIQ